VTRKTLNPERRLLIRRIRITGWTALSFLLATIVGFLAWAHTVYVADRTQTIEVFRSGHVEVVDRERAIIITPTSEETLLADTVLVFYPGGRVDPYAYLPPLAHTAQNTGLRVVIPKVPLNLAITDTREIEHLASLAGHHTVIATGGHSLGGVRGCLQAANPLVSHLVLFASYCANDLTTRGDLTVLSVLGSNDALTDPAQVLDAGELLPGDPQLITIDGANHASFAAYGPQSGDGPSRVDAQRMYDQLTEILSNFLTQ
jgi:pimeloyl-ACP methyl ester carboxylesterase